MLLGDDKLLDFLFIIGICISKKSPISPTQIICIFICLLHIISVVNYVSATIYSIIKNQNLITLRIIFIFGAACPSVTWCSLIVRRKKIFNILIKLFNYRKSYKVENKSLSFVGTLIIAVHFAILVSYQILMYFADTDSSFLTFMTCGANIPEGIWKITLFILVFLFQFTIYSFPVFLSFLLSIIFHKF